MIIYAFASLLELLWSRVERKFFDAAVANVLGHEGNAEASNFMKKPSKNAEEKACPPSKHLPNDV